MKPFYRDFKLGVVGGGQLGRMLIQAAIDYDVHIKALDPSPQAPCRWIAHEFVQGSLTDYDTVMAFGADCDVLTIEIENVNTEALEALQGQGKTVHPDPKTIRLIQDKRTQKQFYKDHGLPTAPFALADDKQAVKELSFSLPAVQKLGKAGYDGRGVQVLREVSDLEKAFDAPSLLESFVDFEKELAVLVARNPTGEVALFPTVEMVFHPEANLVEYLFAPAEIDPDKEKSAFDIATRLVEALDYVGILAVEMFLTKEGEILINEIAPRPHNSGHHTIRACVTSQYEQHLRAILGLPLGSTHQMIPAAMVNLLGEEGQTGPVRYMGIENLLSIPGAHPFFYGKHETRPFRKMGHVTILDTDLQALKKKVAQVRGAMQVVTG